MLFLLIKHLVVLSINFFVHIPKFLFQYFYLNYYSSHKNEFFSYLNLEPNEVLVVKFILKLFLIQANFEIIDNMMLINDVGINLIESPNEKDELILKQKEKNNFQNDPGFLGKFFLKILLSFLVLYFFENFFG